MPLKTCTMDELDKTFDEKLGSFKYDFVSDLKKEIMNEVKARLRIHVGMIEMYELAQT